MNSYLIHKAPDMYGGTQESYLLRSDQAINKGVQVASAHKTSYETLFTSIYPKGEAVITNYIPLFGKLLSNFAKERNEIALSTGTFEGDMFGALHDKSLGERYAIVAKTPLSGIYSPHDIKVKDQLIEIFNRSLPLIDAPFSAGTILDQSESFGHKFYVTIEFIDGSRHPYKPLQALHEASILLKRFTSLNNYKDIEEIRRKSPNTYEKSVLSIAIQTFNYYTSVTSACEDNFEEGTYIHVKSHVSIGDQILEASRYLLWIDTKKQSELIDELKKPTSVVLFHQDPFLKPMMISKIAELFNRAMQWDCKLETLQDLKSHVSLFRYHYAHCTPHVRGDGAIGDWFELLIYRFHGLIARFKEDRLACFETLSSLNYSSYQAVYDEILELGYRD